MKANKQILYIAPAESSFVKLDILYLAKSYEVTTCWQPWGRKSRIVWNFIKQFFYLISHIRSLDVIIISFGGYHSFLPTLIGKIYKKPIFIILNGADSAGFEELKYGKLRRPLERRFCIASYKKATELWPVGVSLIRGENRFGELLQFGVDRYFDRKTPYHVIPNGFEIDKWSFTNNEKSGFVTVVSSVDQFEIKGIRTFLELAKRIPDANFTIVGMDQPDFIQFPGNVHFLGRVKHTDMNEVLNKHQYYCQFSLFEGFGCSLCEGMLTGCIPLCSQVNELPTIVQDSGFILKTENDFDELLEFIYEKRPLNAVYSEKARQVIVKRYRIEERMNAITSRIELYGKKSI